MSRNAISINNEDLKPGMKFIVPSGGTVSITGEVYASNVSPGLIIVETEIGSLYLAEGLCSAIDKTSL